MPDSVEDDALRAQGLAALEDRLGPVHFSLDKPAAL